MIPAYNIVGIDPSSSYTGLACLDASAETPLPGRPLTLRSVAMLAADDDCDGIQRSLVDRVFPVLDEFTGLGDSSIRSRVFVERAPAVAHVDTGRAFVQGRIGWMQGWCAGLICGRYDVRSTAAVGPSDWRESMFIEAARHGLVLQKPSRSRAPSHPEGKAQRFRVDLDPAARGAFIRRWSGCDHEDRYPDYAALQQSTAIQCPACEAEAAKPRSDRAEADWVRDEWKRLACLFVQRLWPAPYEALVLDARSRAKADRPDHQLAGVADACEAAGIAVHGLSLSRGAP